LDFLNDLRFIEQLSFLKNFSVAEVYMISSLTIFALFKLIVVLASKNSLKFSGILIFIIQGATFVLISEFMKETPLPYRLIFFAVLNLLLYFCLSEMCLAWRFRNLFH